jgi:hypothetical protein
MSAAVAPCFAAGVRVWRPNPGAPVYLTYSPWVQLQTSTPQPPARYGHAAGFIEGNQFLVFGGTAQGPNGPLLLNDLWQFDEHTKTWYALSPGTCLCAHSPFVVGCGVH